MFIFLEEAAAHSFIIYSSLEIMIQAVSFIINIATTAKISLLIKIYHLGPLKETSSLQMRQVLSLDPVMIVSPS